MSKNKLTFIKGIAHYKAILFYKFALISIVLASIAINQASLFLLSQF